MINLKWQEDTYSPIVIGKFSSLDCKIKGLTLAQYASNYEDIKECSYDEDDLKQILEDKKSQGLNIDYLVNDYEQYPYIESIQYFWYNELGHKIEVKLCP